MRKAILLILILTNLSLLASEKWSHDFSYDNLQVWKLGKKRLSVEVKKQKNILDNYTKSKVKSYLSKRDQLLKYADFKNFKTIDLKFNKKKDHVEIEKLGSYINSRGKNIFYREVHLLFKKKSLITMLSSESKLKSEDIIEMDKKIQFVREQDSNE